MIPKKKKAFDKIRIVHVQCAQDVFKKNLLDDNDNSVRLFKEGKEYYFILNEATRSASAYDEESNVHKFLMDNEKIRSIFNYITSGPIGRMDIDELTKQRLKKLSIEL